MSKSSIKCILTENKMHACYFAKVHNLLFQDYEHRLNFCEWLLAQEKNQPGFAKKSCSLKNLVLHAKMYLIFIILIFGTAKIFMSISFEVINKVVSIKICSILNDSIVS